QLADNTLPTGIRLDHLAAHQCAVLQDVRPFNQSFTHADVQEWLTDLLPVPMVHGHTNATVVAGKKPQAFWALLSKKRNLLEVVPVDQPNGHDLFRHKGPQKS
ncbi:hypothetical protein C8J56DRAFT_714040, partial [Mycena floridula]